MENGFGGFQMNNKKVRYSLKKLEQVEHLEQVTNKMLIKTLILNAILTITYI